MRSLIKKFFRTKQVGVLREIEHHSKLKRSLGVFSLLSIGIGAVIGSGIFVFTGIAAQIAGPAVILSFAVAGVTCIFVALIYTEVASALPISGGSYTYSYVSLGEPIAWLVGWAAIVQFGCVAIAVSIGWSAYLLGVLEQFNIIIPQYLSKGVFEGGLINLPAVFIAILMSFILAKGTEESSVINIVLVIIKLIAIFIFLGVSAPHIDAQNWSNFFPFGVNGMIAAAGTVFLSYTGFDAIANAAEETKKPERNIVIALIGAVLFSTILYVLVSAAATGVVHYTKLNVSNPLTYALKLHNINIGGAVVVAGAITGMTSVIILQMFALTRVLIAMSRDGLLPKCFGKIHPKYATPYINTMIVGCCVAISAGLFPTFIIGNMASIGTLFVLSFVIISAMKLRYQKPNLHRPFKCPVIYIIGTISLCSCCYIFFSLCSIVGFIFFLWLMLGSFIYFVYSRRQASKIYNQNNS